MTARLGDCSSILQLGFGLNLLIPSLISRVYAERTRMIELITQKVEEYRRENPEVINRYIETINAIKPAVEPYLREYTNSGAVKDFVDEHVLKRIFVNHSIIFFLITSGQAVVFSFIGLTAAASHPNSRVPDLVMYIYSVINIAVTPLAGYIFIAIFKVFMGKELKSYSNHDALRSTFFAIQLHRSSLALRKIVKAWKMRQSPFGKGGS